MASGKKKIKKKHLLLINGRRCQIFLWNGGNFKTQRRNNLKMIFAKQIR